jgi:hypothetical protein
MQRTLLQPPDRQDTAPPRDTTGAPTEQILEPSRRLLENPLVLTRLTEDDIEHLAMSRVRH